MGIADDTPQSCSVVLPTLPIFESSDNSQSVACRRRYHSSFKRGCIAIALPILGGNYLEKNPCCI
ncbi:hypothetical protein [Nostoc sp.]